MEFRVLGPLEVVDDGRALSLGSGRQLAVVAVLVVHANEVVSVDRLVDALWAESPPPTAAKIVRNYVSLLRKELGERLVTRAPGYLLRIENGELDSARLERALGGGDEAALKEALALWRGSPLSQFAGEQFAQAEIARLEELQLAAIEARLDAELAAGRHAAAIAQLESRGQQHPLRERLCGQLMVALYRAGRQADALEAYRRLRRTLDDELGIEPGPALRDLERRILNHDPALELPAPPPEPAAPVARGRRRRIVALVAAAALVLASAAVVAALLAFQDGGGLAGIEPNHVGAVDPATGKIVATIPVGIRPGPVAAGAGAVWVGNLRDRTLTRIDPAQRSVTATVSLGDRTPTGIAAGARDVWVAHGGSGELSRVSARFGRVTQTIEITARPYASPTGAVTLGEGAVWAVYGDSTLARVRPGSGRATGSALTGASPSSLTIADGTVWVANGADATVQRFNPATFEQGAIGRAISVGKQPAAIAAGHDAVWVASRGDDTVTRIDPATRSVATISVGDEPVAVAAGAGAVWVANAGDGTVSRIDPEERRVTRTVRVSNAPAGIVVADGLVWVAVQEP